MMNSLFKEDFDVEMTEITFENNEFVSDDYDIIRGDLFLKISKGNKPYHYHIELQTKNDATMVIRMFEYGFKKAKELSKYQVDDEKEIVIYIPKQLVIFVEQNRNIKDELKMKLVFPGGQEIKYAVPTMKYWEYSDIDIMQDKMYPLLPLQVFKLRYKMEQIKKKYGEGSSEIKETIMEAKKISETISKEGSQLFNNAEIDGDDLHRILLAVANLFEYLNTKYGDDEKLNEEVRNMTKTLYDPAVEQRGIKKGIEQGIEKGIEKGDIRAREEMVKEMLLDGESIVKIKKYSKLSEEEITEIKNKIKQ
ncbi:RpnC/YadD family protein [Clostridium estertheticum]|nr:hypothetical protein [Clostridium estertheticum]MBZ9614671.1 hypothetical protein [Clostridium estertheticum subsp. laramiense]NNU77516.1 hypothetical protein [Clostridium estertheticum]WAG74594.1 hypothetical protein LL032_03795 [Clostridium estertheticum]WBL48540.1 hypothetical protein LOR37_07750 [Clostridium estertheticum]